MSKQAEAQEMPDVVEDTIDTLHGDLTQAIVEELQQLPDVWAKVPESKQKGIIDRCRMKAGDQIRRAVTLLAQQGNECAPAVVESVTFKDGVKVVLKMHDRDGAHNCADREGRAVTVIFVDPEDYLNGGAFPEAEPDQQDLSLVEGGED